MTKLLQYEIITGVFVVLFLFFAVAAIKLITFLIQDFDSEEKKNV